MAPTPASLKNLRPAWQRGKPKTGGKQKGTPNLLTSSFREFLEICKADPTYRQRFLEDWQRGKKPHIETIVARAEVGDPTQRVDAQVRMVIEVEGFKPPAQA